MPLVKKSTAKAGFASHSLLIIFSVVVVIAVGVAGYFYIQYQKTQAMLKSPTAAAQAESAKLVADVGKLIVLPAGEAPTIATVSDINKLKTQSFFAHAKNGDKVLIYTKAQKAILYDPAQKKIIEVGPINLAQSSPSPIPSVSATPAAMRVALYNGTAKVGLTTTVEKQLKIDLPTVTVVAKENAAKTTYAKTVVIDLSADKAGLNGKKAAGAAQLAKTLNGEVGSLPTGETKPKDADILVILGK